MITLLRFIRDIMPRNSSTASTWDKGEHMDNSELLSEQLGFLLINIIIIIIIIIKLYCHIQRVKVT